VLSEMEMLDESGEGIWRQPMEYLPCEILPSSQEIENEMQQDRKKGFLIPYMKEDKLKG
jgi:hypothetical protein